MLNCNYAPSLLAVLFPKRVTFVESVQCFFFLAELRFSEEYFLKTSYELHSLLYYIYETSRNVLRCVLHLQGLWLVTLTTGSRKFAAEPESYLNLFQQKIQIMSSDHVKPQRPDGGQFSNIKSKWLSRLVILMFQAYMCMCCEVRSHCVYISQQTQNGDFTYICLQKDSQTHRDDL